MRRPRQRRTKPRGRHLSISATDAEWEVVRANAKARGLSIARYLVGLAERDGEEDVGLALALSREEQRELVEGVREIRSLLLEDPGPLVRDMQERIAVQFRAWASAMARARPDELMAALSAVLGEDRARAVAASIEVRTPKAKERSPDPRQERLL